MIVNFFHEIGLAPWSAPFWIALLLLGCAATALEGWRRAGRRATRLREQLEATRINLASAESRAEAGDAWQDALAEERARRESLEANLAANKAKLEERERALEETRARLDAEFKAAASEIMERAHQSFFTRTKETFERYSESAAVDSQQRRKALDELLRPVSETLARYEKSLADLRAEQQKSRGELAGQIGELSKSAHTVRLEAQKLATALRAGPKTRGRWGEEQLRNVVEIAGMTAYVDFTEQTGHSDGERRKLPDMVVRLPGGRVVAVDSKVSLNAYLDAVEADTDEKRTACLARHGEDVWAHVKSLSTKEYAASLQDSLDYVVMFVPGENYYSAALEARPQLYQDAFNKKILVASPTILLAVLKSAALNWRQEKMTENAQAIAAMAKDLYDSLRRMGGNLSGLGRAIERTVKQYNDVVANVEGRVLPRARKFAEYELPGTEEAIDQLALLEGAPRLLRDDTKMPEPDCQPNSISEKKNDAA